MKMDDHDHDINSHHCGDYVDDDDYFDDKDEHDDDDDDDKAALADIPSLTSALFCIIDCIFLLGIIFTS